VDGAGIPVAVGISVAVAVERGVAELGGVGGPDSPAESAGALVPAGPAVEVTTEVAPGCAITAALELGPIVEMALGDVATIMPGSPAVWDTNNTAPRLSAKRSRTTTAIAALMSITRDSPSECIRLLLPTL